MTQAPLDLEIRPPAAWAARCAAADCRHAIARARQAEGAADGLADGRDAPAWWRLALLRSFVTRLPHDEAAALPLRVLPLPGLAPVNPVQALQAGVTLALARPDGLRRLQRLAERLADDRLRLAFHRFVSMLLPRLIEARGGAVAVPGTAALEAAWADPRALRGWHRFAAPLGEARSAALAQSLADEHAPSGDNARFVKGGRRWPSTNSPTMCRSSAPAPGSPTARP